MAQPAGLRLVKWYADAIAPDGSGFVAYHVELTWRSAAARLASVLRIPPAGAPCTAAARARAAPRLDCAEGRAVAWPASRLLPASRWEPLAPAFETTLLSRGGRSLTWSCLAPSATVSQGPTACALGYAERIETTLAPWNLPIEELRWGRFVSEGASLVWIDWRGPHPLRLVLLNGLPAEEAAVHVDDDHVRTRSATLEMGVPRVLRDGVVGTTVLERLPLVKKTFPARLLALAETKWLRRGTLHDFHGTHDGWVIHEVVRWP